MSRPWQIWLVYALGLAGVAGAFGWLTVKALELDRAEVIARRQAELEEDISRALWRMDSLLTPLLAEEAARPEFVYRSVYHAPMSGAAKSVEREISPLLTAPPQFVLLHFEVYPDGKISSPQCPTGDENDWALNHGASAEAIRAASERLEMLRPVLSHAALLGQLPDQPLPLDLSRLDGAAPNSSQGQATNPPIIANSYENLTRQLAQQQADGYGISNGQGFGQGPQPGGQPNAPPQLTMPAEEAQRVGQRTEALAEQQGGGMPGGFGGFGGNSTIESGRLQRSQSRAGNDLVNREAALQEYARKSVVEQRGNYKTVVPPIRAVEGVSRPLWVGEHLLIARRLQVSGKTVIQGCWLDWDQLKTRLREEVMDLLPQIELAPLATAAPIKLSRLLATIPVQLSVPALEPPALGWSPIRVSLLVAWACLLVSALAIAAMLQGVMAMSERRGAFVAAVTHELRTPLTTFRMYAEMLSEGMVPDAAQRQRYLETLRIEADRLAHLVENVLQYARLERGKPGKRREEISLAGLLDRCQSRLAERASQAEMKLVVDEADGDRDIVIPTDAAAVEQILFNLVDNACKYANQAADKRLHLVLAGEPGRVTIAVRDHGPGISAAGRRQLFRPFSKSVHEAANSAPGVGLGLALSRRLAADLGGRLEFQSPAEGGAEFVLTLPRAG